MIDLTNPEEIKKLDPKDVYGSTEMLASQCKQIWYDAKKVNFPNDYKKIRNIVICGMGGSAYGAHIVLSLFKDDLKVPLFLNSDYSLPASVDDSSLVVLTSYSGSTEETLSGADQALEKRAKITGLTSGGKLGEFLKKNHLPGLIFTPKYNPCGQPRLGTGYIVIGTIAILNQLGFLNIDEKDIKKAISELENNQNETKEKAMTLAKKIVNSIPVIFAAEFLGGNAHIIRNQFNETAKSFATFSELPELNHHLMEGLKNPKDKKITVFFLDSNFYSDLLKKRIFLTKDVVLKNKIPSLEYQAKGSSKISQMLNVLSFGGYLTVYLALLYGLDPSLIPWVDYFKEQLKK